MQRRLTSLPFREQCFYGGRTKADRLRCPRVQSAPVGQCLLTDPALDAAYAARGALVMLKAVLRSASAEDWMCSHAYPVQVDYDGVVQAG